MVVPLTDYERKVWKESAEDIIAHPENEPRTHMQVLARERLRYEQTIQDVEAQRAALVTALEKTKHPLRQAECYFDGEMARLYGQTLRRVEAAIKEATS